MKGHVELWTKFAGTHSISVKYLVAERESPYNAILERPSLNKIRAIISTPHLAVKFPLPNGQVAAIRADQKEARQCYVDCLKAKISEPVMPTFEAIEETTFRLTDVNLAKLDPREDFKEERPQPEGELILVKVNPREDGYVKIGAQLLEKLKSRLTEHLETNAYLFAWVPADMTGIYPNFMCHHLVIEPAARLVARERVAD